MSLATRPLALRLRALRRTPAPSALALAGLALAACQEATGPGEPHERPAAEERTAAAENDLTPSPRPNAVLFGAISGYTGSIAVPTPGVACTTSNLLARSVEVKPITVGAPPEAAYVAGDNTTAVWADVVLWYLDGSTWRVLARKAFWSNSTIQRNAFIVGGVNLANATVSGVKFTHYRATDGRDWPLPATSYSVQTVLTWYAMNAMGSTRWVGQRTVAYQHASDYVGLGQVGINAGSCRLLV